MEWRESKPADRVRTADGEVFLARRKLRRPHVNRTGGIRSQPACAAQPLEGARWRTDGGAGTRTRRLFVRNVDKFGNPIPETNRCAFCHSGPQGTNQKSFDVGTRKSTDNSGLLDTPQLTNIAITAPYLHDGSAPTLEQIWTVFNLQDKHGRTNDLTKDELNDLIEYLRTR